MGYAILPKRLVDGFYRNSIEVVKDAPVCVDKFYLITRRQTQSTAASIYIQNFIVEALKD